jgi:hypothetical protein
MSIVTIVAYAILLVTMLIGLLRKQHERSFGIWILLFQQVRCSPIAGSLELTSLLDV